MYSSVPLSKQTSMAYSVQQEDPKVPTILELNPDQFTNFEAATFY